MQTRLGHLNYELWRCKEWLCFYVSFRNYTYYKQLNLSYNAVRHINYNLSSIRHPWRLDCNTNTTYKLIMTTVNQQKTMFYNAGLMANITMLSERVNRTLDFKYLETCDETELRQLQDNLVEQYNNLLAKEKAT